MLVNGWDDYKSTLKSGKAKIIIILADKTHPNKTKLNHQVKAASRLLFCSKLNCKSEFFQDVKITWHLTNFIFNNEVFGIRGLDAEVPGLPLQWSL